MTMSTLKRSSDSTDNTRSLTHQRPGRQLAADRSVFTLLFLSLLQHLLPLSERHDSPPVEGAALQPGTCVQRAGVQGHDAVALEFWEGLGGVLQSRGHAVQRVVHPRRHLVGLGEDGGPHSAGGQSHDPLIL